MDDAEAIERVRIATWHATYRGQLPDAALDAHDGPVFERVFGAATDRANELHVKWAKPYIRWVLPGEAPSDLELGPAD